MLLENYSHNVLLEVKTEASFHLRVLSKGEAERKKIVTLKNAFNLNK